MKRHPALVPFSHDHQHALVAARRLREGGDGRAFVRFYLGALVRHFREEEEALFPLLVAEAGEVDELVVTALAQHAQVHAGARALAAGGDRGEALARLVEAHVRLEERELFPLLEERLPAAEPVAEEALRLALDLGGALSGVASDDLNATVVVWGPGEGASAATVNAERDVLLVPLAGAGTVEIDGARHRLDGRRAVVVPKGASRRIESGPLGLRYLSIHRRRPSTLQVERRGDG